VEKAEALLATGLEVDGFLLQGSVIKGVKVGKEEFPADGVVVAEGANSLLALKAGLRREFSPQDMKQGVKEVIRLPQKTIEERFHLPKSYQVMKEAMKGKLTLWELFLDAWNAGAAGSPVPREPSGGSTLEGVLVFVINTVE